MTSVLKSPITDSARAVVIRIAAAAHRQLDPRIGKPFGIAHREILPRSL
jgi:hypothetical protein